MSAPIPALPTLNEIAEIIEQFSTALLASAFPDAEFSTPDKLRVLSADLERHGADPERIRDVRNLANAIDKLQDLLDCVGAGVELAAAGIKPRDIGDVDDGGAA